MKRQRIKWVALFCVMCFMTLLTACGGGGGGGTSEGTTGTTTATGNVIDGYLKNSLVCIDGNSNGSCDTTQDASNDTGGYSINYSLAYTDPRLIAVDGEDTVTGQQFDGVLMASVDDDNITPLTTLIEANSSIKKLLIL